MSATIGQAEDYAGIGAAVVDDVLHNFVSGRTGHLDAVTDLDLIGALADVGHLPCSFSLVTGFSPVRTPYCLRQSESIRKKRPKPPFP